MVTMATYVVVTMVTVATYGVVTMVTMATYGVVTIVTDAGDGAGSGNTAWTNSLPGEEVQDVTTGDGGEANQNQADIRGEDERLARVLDLMILIPHVISFGFLHFW